MPFSNRRITNSASGTFRNVIHNVSPVAVGNLLSGVLFAYLGHFLYYIAILFPYCLSKLVKGTYSLLVTGG